MKCRTCGKPLKKIEDDNVKFTNATYQGVCQNEKCNRKGMFVATGVIKGNVTKVVVP